MTIKNIWTDIPDGTRVQLIWNDEPWFGKVLKTEPIAGQQVFVQWAPNHFSWESPEDLFLATDVIEVTPEMINAALDAFYPGSNYTIRQHILGVVKIVPGVKSTNELMETALKAALNKRKEINANN